MRLFACSIWLTANRNQGSLTSNSVSQTIVHLVISNASRALHTNSQCSEAPSITPTQTAKLRLLARSLHLHRMHWRQDRQPGPLNRRFPISQQQRPTVHPCKWCKASHVHCSPTVESGATLSPTSHPKRCHTRKSKTRETTSCKKHNNPSTSPPEQPTLFSPSSPPS